MRAPYQVISIPYRFSHGALEFCVLHRADCEMWQFVSGGGEDDETPLEAAYRETFEEYGISVKGLTQLTSMAYLPKDAVISSRRQHWDKDIIVIPEYSFGFECDRDPILSEEHDSYRWLAYDEARKLLTWDSNKVAMYELMERLKQTDCGN